MSGLRESNPLLSAGALDDFEPRRKPEATPIALEASRAEKVAVRQSAEERGFRIDNTTTTVRAKRPGSGKLSKSHTLRLYVQDINRFQTWCNDNGYSQARGFELLLDRALG